MSTQLHTAPIASTEPSGRTRSFTIREIAWYVGVVYAMCVSIALLLPGTKAEPGPAPLLALFSPMIAVGIVRFVARRRRPDVAPLPLGLRRLGLRSWLPAIVFPILAVGGSFVATDAVGVVGLHDAAGFLTNAPINVVLMSVILIGEEIGWRGFMLPRMQTLVSDRKATMITGVTQAAFHLPLIVFTSSYDNAGNRIAIACGAFAVISLAGSLFGWLRIHSGSLWPVTIAHAVANTCIVETPDLVTHNADRAAYFTGEAGIFTLVGVGLVAIWILRRADWSAPKTKPKRQKPEAATLAA